MTDQCMTQQALQEDARRSHRCCSKHVERDIHSDDENVKEQHRYERLVSDPLQAFDSEQQESSGRRKPALVRSKTFDHSLLTHIPTDSDPKIERKKPQYSQISKGNSQYHKIFKEISKEEQLIQSYTCALQKDILYQGRMFVSAHLICFHSKVFGKDTKIAIPVVSVTHIKKTKTAILVPNALVIATENDKYVFVSFLSRDNTYKILMSICPHLEVGQMSHMQRNEKSPCSSPIPSSADNSFRGQRSPHFSLRFPGDFVDLDGTLRHRRQELEESSSSDSQTPDYEKIAEFSVPPFLDVVKHAASPESPEHQHKVKRKSKQSSEKQHESHHTGSQQLTNRRTVSVNTLLLVYLFLVCVLLLSSCYLAFKITLLEQKLSTLSSIQDFSQQDKDFLQDTGVNADPFTQLLTLNLIKLEKVQKSLQRLLEEAG
ncbi:GRAM domain-containing protein 2B isoform X1 [Takifugu flavidus]|uniref:GRAM domain-containing protein 2B isoform X1 n=1 Tax=Takifugu flavidus TaxID=433684 RepID=UPI002544D000|nr:GRAM domain-containing protein 2B isoform X1 [Takifugu flavidus]